MFKKRKKGFTLIELLVVMVVLAILAIITVPNALRMIETAEVRANTQSLSGLVKAAEEYYVKQITGMEEIAYGENIYGNLSLNNNRLSNARVSLREDGRVSISVVLGNKCYIKEYNTEINVHDDIDLCGSFSLEPVINPIVAHVNFDGPSSYDDNDKITFNHQTRPFTLVGNWSTATMSTPWTTSLNAYATFTFIGTGFDIEFRVGSSNNNTTVEIWIDDEVHSVHNLRASHSNTYINHKIARNLENKEHTVRIVRKNTDTSNTVQFRNVTVYQSTTSVNDIDSIPEYSNALVAMSTDIFYKEYYIYRSLTPNIDPRYAEPHMVFNSSELTSSLNQHMFNIPFEEPLDYYYRIMAVDNNGYAYLNDEEQIVLSEGIEFNNLTLNPFYKYSFEGSNSNAWISSSINTINPISGATTLKATMKFYGTGADLAFRTGPVNNSNSRGVAVVMVDGEVVFVFDQQDPSLSTITYQNINIARNLPYGEHTIQVYVLDGTVRLEGIRTYNETTSDTIALSGYYENGSNILNFDRLGYKHYEIYRSETPNINVNTATPIDIIGYGNSLTPIPSHFSGQTGWTFQRPIFANYTGWKYLDYIPEFKNYYYKVVAVDYSGNKVVSNEYQLVIPSTYSYNWQRKNPNLINSFNQSAWGSITTDGYRTGNRVRHQPIYPEVEFLFTGTRIELEIFRMTNGIQAAEVYLNDVLIDTISTRNTTTGWVNYVLADNLPNQTHRLRLRGLDTDDASYLRIRNVYITK